ncbi:MAG: EamA family transporter [Phycisphaerales bacterium]|nr:EamA family transporter [Phycisphaerales bacterium]
MTWLADHAWLVLALSSAALWAIVHVLDAYCVSRVYERPYMGTIMGGLMTLGLLPALALGLVGSGWQPMTGEAWFLALLCGLAYMTTQWMYFVALDSCESGIVSAYWNSLSFFLPLASYVILGETLPPLVYIGIALVAGTSVGFAILDQNATHRWKAFFLMQAAVLLQVAYFLLQDRLFKTCPTYQGFIVISVFIGLVGAAPLLMRPCRETFRRNWPTVRPALKFLVLIELTNSAAVACSQFAVANGRPSLVAAAEATMPAFTFFFSLVLFWATRHYGEEEAKHRFWLKLLLTGVMAYGVSMLH